MKQAATGIHVRAGALFSPPMYSREKKVTRWLLVLWSAAATNALCATDAVEQCTAIVDDADRLACYDRMFGSPHAPANGASNSGSVTDDRRSSGAKKVFNFSAAVTTVDRRRDGLFVITLDNDQVWAQTELNSRADVRIGDVVTIRKGALGSYMLSTRAGIGTRVRRMR